MAEAMTDIYYVGGYSEVAAASHQKYERESGWAEPLRTQYGMMVLCIAVLSVLPGCAAARRDAGTSLPIGTEMSAATASLSTSTPAASLEPTATCTATSTATNTPAPTATPFAPGLILYESVDEFGPALWQVNGDGTGAHVVVPYDPEVGGFGLFPRWSPGGRHFAYLYASSLDDERRESVWVAERDGSRAFQVGDLVSSAASVWADANMLAYYCVRGGAPYTYTYHLDTGALVEGLSPFIEAALEMPGFDQQHFACSSDCSKVAATKDGRKLFIVDHRTGEARKVFEVSEQESGGSVYTYGWSSDDERLAFGHTYTRGDTIFWDLYTVRADEQDVRRLTDFEAGYRGKTSPTGVGAVVWSPDDEWLAFLISIDWKLYIGVIPAAGGAPKNLGCGPLHGITDPVWSPDSTKLAFLCNQRFENGRFEPEDDQWDLYTVDIHTGEIQRLTNDKTMEMHVDWR